MGSWGLFCSRGLTDVSEGCALSPVPPQRCARGDLQPLPALQRLCFESYTYRKPSLRFLLKFCLKDLLFFLTQAESRAEETFLPIPPLVRSLTSCWETSASLLLLLHRCSGAEPPLCSARIPRYAAAVCERPRRCCCIQARRAMFLLGYPRFCFVFLLLTNAR